MRGITSRYYLSRYWFIWDNITFILLAGITLTLSDLLLFFIVHLMFKEMMQRFVFDQTIPFVFKWYHRMLNLNMTKPNLAVFLALRICLKEQSKDTIQSELVVNPHTVLTYNGIEKIRVAQLPLPATCLYSQSKMNMSLRTRVKHKDASKLLRVLQHCPSLIKENVDFHQLLPWDELPEEVRPESGGLPEKRIQRKREQISNVVNAVISLIDNGSCRWKIPDNYSTYLLRLMIPQKAITRIYWYTLSI